MPAPKIESIMTRISAFCVGEFRSHFLQMRRALSGRSGHIEIKDFSYGIARSASPSQSARMGESPGSGANIGPAHRRMPSLRQLNHAQKQSWEVKADGRRNLDAR